MGLKEIVESLPTDKQVRFLNATTPEQRVQIQNIIREKRV